MTENWSFKKFDKNLEYTYKGEREFVDFRGKISNYELTEPINLIGYIESVKGSMRANHYHPVQEVTDIDGWSDRFGVSSSQS